MSLDAEKLARLSTLLDTAAELEGEAREQWLAALIGADAELLPTLRRLLARPASRSTDDLLDRGPAFTAIVGEPEEEAAQFKTGERVGLYVLERAIGQGGMGEVWLAVREDGQLKRRVALKLPMISARRSVLVQRFARERDILGSLAHPNIARLYDAGLGDDGQPYLALEYVEGQPITDYATAHGLDARGRVRLLLQVMQAVQYAHANLVIHRDLKPSNVLVTAQGQAMLLDFGIAKLLQEEAGDAAETELTRVGGRAMTLHYAAPEQVAGAPISIATDVWALGVLLYELLSGRRPFAGKQRDLEQAILGGEPARLGEVAADLATIVLKALKKAPSERYATVNAFAEDLKRWLDGQPVLAQPDRLGYRLRKFVGRHRGAVIASAAAVIVLLASSLIALLQATDARRQAAVAREQAALAKQQAERAQAVQGFLGDLFRANSVQQADPQAARKVTARELLDRGAERVDKALEHAPQARIEVMATLADMYVQLSLFEQAASLQRRRVELGRQVYGPADPDRAEVLLSYADTLHEGAQRDLVPALVKEALAVLDAAGDHSSFLRGIALLQAARYARYEPLAQARQSADEAVAYLGRHFPERPSLITAYLLAARARINAGDFVGAAAEAARAIDAAKRRGAQAAAWLVTPTIVMAETQQARLQYGRAEVGYREAIAMQTHLSGADDPDTLTTTTKLGNLLVMMGRSAEGAALLATVRDALRGSDRRMTTQWRANISALADATLAERGRPDLMLPATRANVEQLRRDLPRSALLALHERRLAELEIDLGHEAAAREAMLAAEAVGRVVSAGADGGEIDTATAITRAHIATLSGAPDAALLALDIARPVAPRDAILRGIERARAMRALDRPAEAMAAADEAVRAVTALPEGERPVALHALALEQRGEARRRLGNRDDARADLRHALEIRRAHDAEGSRHLARLEREIAELPTR